MVPKIDKKVILVAVFVPMLLLVNLAPECLAVKKRGGQHEPWDMLQAKPEVVEAWQDMRFGMFNCWGPVSLTGLEIGWSRGAPRGGEFRVREGQGPTPVEVYDNLHKKWRPDKFDARRWVQVAKDAGQKYMIFLVKHHGGFCLYDSKLTNHKITSPESAWKVDVMKAVADACHEAGLKLIIYYSQPDWHHGDYLTENHDRYIKYLHGQIRELLTNYGHIDGLWFDNLRGRGHNPEAAKLWDAENLFKMARQLQPHLIINDRCGLDADFYTPEQRLGKFQLERPWETCMTLGTQWAWKPNDKIKSLKKCIDVLVTCAGRNGNLALNTGPMPDGRIEPRQVERFREIGRWLKQYGESIYGTRGGPFWGINCVSTRKDDTIYLHVLKWYGEVVALPAIDKKIVSSSVLTGGTATVKQTDEGIEISVPPEHRRELDTIIVLELDGPAVELPPAQVLSSSLTAAKKAKASNVFQKNAAYGPAKAVDDDPATRWATDISTKQAWLEVDLGKPTTFNRVKISEAYDRVREFELQCRDGSRWKTFARGTKIGLDYSKQIEPVTARYVRLNILKVTDGPTICELQLFAPKK